MDSQLKSKFRNKCKRATRNRKHLRGNQEQPRLCVIKTNKHLHVQLIDDEASTTIASTSTISKDFKGGDFGKKNKDSAKQLGLKIAELAKNKNVKRAVFDRGPFKYHGVVAALADGAREGGLEV
jgi:large subunit ribosomal protein L18